VYRTSVKQTLYLLIPICALLVVAVYRVVQTYTINPSPAARKLSTFWILQITFELCVAASSIPSSPSRFSFSRPANCCLGLGLGLGLGVGLVPVPG
jgi:hypothetical protein